VLSFTAMQRIFVARDPQDMRRGIDTLVCVVEHELGHEPYTGDCFIFLSRDRKKLKALIWEPGGFWICMKRLITGTFATVASWSASTDASVAVTPARVHALLEGIDMKNTHYRARTRADG
jgi:transposase